MHLAALHGVDPREPVEYMHYLRAAQPPKPFLPEDRVLAFFEELCELMKPKEAVSPAPRPASST
ncbi:MAG TPA: hypothetical protein DCX12_01045 [Chloroflexi bacterium]|jgi:hypothetical protein|nr:hypothetical protein [Chloroflexota bacterium]